ncbi:MAG: SMC-Scp complex subunit ScpB [bacterium]|nr:SMC-Scp complex subunit ScpB [bacterium]
MSDGNVKEIRSAIEALLFVSTDPVVPSKISDILDISLSEVDEHLCALADEYERDERGIQLREVAGGWRLYTHPAYHDIVEKYVLSWDTQKLSQAALEALAVIAYNQPATRAMVSSIRGVNSDGVIASLVEKGLVREAGRDSAPGQPILYATTKTFLEKFGLKSLTQLPMLEDFAPNEETRELIRERLSARKISDILDDRDVEGSEVADDEEIDDEQAEAYLEQLDIDDRIELISDIEG